MLNGNSQGVVHSTPARTRLRVPADYRDREEMRKLESRIQHVPGVKYCETNEHTGSITVFHDSQPEMLENIGQAIKGLDQKLFQLLSEERSTEDKKRSVFSDMFGRAKQSATEATQDIDVDEAKRLVKKGLPLAFIAAGIYTLAEAESLLAGVAPVVLFYYAFDLYWKFSEERRTKRIESQAQQT